MHRSIARFAAVIGSTRDTVPRVVAANISADGLVLYVVFSERVTEETPDGFTIDPSGGAATLTYASGTGTNSLAYTIGRAIAFDETATIDFSSGVGAVEDLSGNALVTFADLGVTNGSLAGAPTFDSYLRPGGVDTFLRPGGVDSYVRP